MNCFRGKFSPPEFVVVLDRLRSAHNVGNIFRLADAVGAREVICCGSSPHPPHPKLARTAMGAEKSGPFRSFEKTADAVADLKERGFCVFAMETVENAVPPNEAEYRFPLALVFGNEALGVGVDVLKMCDGAVCLPMFGTKTSINVGNCAAVALYFLIEKYGRMEKNGL